MSTVRSAASHPPLALCQAGVASGPHALGLLSARSASTLAPLVHACLSLIALAAGAELHLPELRRLRRQVGWTAVCCPQRPTVHVAMLDGCISTCFPAVAACPSHSPLLPSAVPHSQLRAGGLSHCRNQLLFLGTGLPLVGRLLELLDFALLQTLLLLQLFFKVAAAGGRTAARWTDCSSSATSLAACGCCPAASHSSGA